MSSGPQGAELLAGISWAPTFATADVGYSFSADPCHNLICVSSRVTIEETEAPADGKCPRTWEDTEAGLKRTLSQLPSLYPHWPGATQPHPDAFGLAVPLRETHPVLMASLF